MDKKEVGVGGDGRGWAEASAEHNDIVLFVSLANSDEEEED